MSAASLNPRAPLPSLMTSLARAGWGPLAGRRWQGVRSTLSGLVARLPHASGQGLVTVEQIAAGAGLSVRWTRRCLYVLEDRGLIRWTRGGIVAGKPAPSCIRVIKSALVGVIGASRILRDACVATHQAATAARIAKLGRLYVKSKPRRYNPRSNQAALATALRSASGSIRPAPASRTPIPTTEAPMTRAQWLAAHGFTSWRDAVERLA